MKEGHVVGYAMVMRAAGLTKVGGLEKRAISTNMIRRLQNAGQIPAGVSPEDIMKALRTDVWNKIPGKVRDTVGYYERRFAPSYAPMGSSRNESIAKRDYRSPVAFLGSQDRQRYNDISKARTDEYNLPRAERQMDPAVAKSLVAEADALEAKNVPRYEKHKAFVRSKTEEEVAENVAKYKAQHAGRAIASPRTIEEGVPLPSPYFDPERRVYRGSGSEGYMKVKKHEPRWVSAHPEVGITYGGRVRGDDTVEPEYLDLFPKDHPSFNHLTERIREYDLTKVPKEEQSPWSHMLGKDTRGMTKSEVDADPILEGADQGRSPFFEKVITEGALRGALKNRWKLLPGGDMMLMEEFK